MTPDRERRVERICHEALALDGAARDALVAEACAGDEALRREVESLLRQQSKADGFLSTPALIGRKLGVYQIQSLLGAGGMGEVYRARDTRLGRDVAIKILPPLFVTDPERLARFAREARILAALNHPNVGAIYGLEDIDGIPSLVLELIDGPTLADRLAEGSLPLRDALTIAAQIAMALEAADERGIVHRDLKPANIKLRPDGTVKVLDFGLAKLVTGDAAGAGSSQSPTITSGETGKGAILGTAAYMSPEQARGKAVDKRTDVWAFGCVLFEMLTGKLAFAGDTLSDTIVSILHGEPDWHALADKTPAAIQRLLHRCVEKDPTRRLRDIGDARIEIEDVLSSASTASATNGITPPRRSIGLSWSAVTAASLVALVAVGGLAWRVRIALLEPTTTSHVSRMMIASSGATAVAPNDKRSLAMTPDGTRVVYVGNGGKQLFVRPLDQLEATAIVTSTAPLNFVFVTPDGQSVGFEEGQSIRKVALSGGPVSTFGQPILHQGATWAADDAVIIGSYSAGLRRMSAGGTVTILTQIAPERGELAHAWPEMLPGRRAVLFTVLAAQGGIAAAQVAVLDLASGTSTVLVHGGSDAHYVSSGHLVYTADDTLKAVQFDLSTLKLRGTPVTVLPHLLTKPTGGGEFDVAADGTLAYLDAPGAMPSRATTLVWVTRQGREELISPSTRPYSQPRVSPDGTRVAVVMSESGAGPDSKIWVWDIARRRLDLLTVASSGYFYPVWTSDGRRLIFGRPGREVFWQSADGTGITEPLKSGAGLPSSVTPDGKRLIFSPNGRDVMMLELDTRRIQPLVATSANERNGVVSPDGHWLAYESDNGGQFEIYVKPFPNVDGGLWQISTAGGTRPLWAPNGQDLFYVAPDGAVVATRVHPRGSAWSVESPVKLFSGPYATGEPSSGRNYDISSDGTRFLMIKQPSNQASPVAHIVVTQNWFEELTRLVPANR